MFKIIKTVICVLIASYSFSFNVLGDFKKLTQHYLDLKELELDFEISYFGNAGNKLMQQKGNVVYGKDIKYSEISGIVTLFNNREFISVNNANKYLIYNKAEKTKKSSEEEQMSINALLDSLWKSYANLQCKLVKEDGFNRTVVIQDDNNEHYSSYELTYSTKSFKLLKYCSVVKASSQQEVSRVEIIYTKEGKPDLKEDKLRISHYLDGTQGNKKPSKYYKSFHFIDQTKYEYEPSNK